MRPIFLREGEFEGEDRADIAVDDPCRAPADDEERANLVLMTTFYL
jgi:hypothetical protein